MHPTSSRLLVSLWLASAASGCTPAPVEPDDVGLPTGGSGTPHPVDSGRPVEPLGCVIEEGGVCREVGPDDVVPIVAADGIHMPGAGFGLGDGSFVAAVSDYSAGRILIARSTDLRVFPPPEPIDPLPVSDCTGATFGGRSFLYFVGWPGGLTRAELTAEGVLLPSEPVTLTGAPAPPYWPQAVGTERGVLLGFVASQTSASLATSDDGLQFDVEPAPVGTDNLRGVLLHVGQTAGGRWVFTHQDADPSWRFTSKVQWSADGVGWSGPIVVDDSTDNVHDAFPVARLDAGADIYFLKAGPDQELNVFRRSLGEDGELGPVQGVTDPAVGHVEKPQARRLQDGRIGLMFAMRKTPERYDVGFAVLDDDAPTE